MTTVTVNKENKAFIHPYKVILYLSMTSMLMFFAITTSALLVKKGDIVSWEAFKLPSIFYVSTVILLASSIAMHFAKNLYRDAKFSLSRMVMFIGVLLSIVFLFTQYMGFQSLMAIGKPLAGNASGSFVYVIVMAHGVHIIGGILFALIILINAFRNRNNQQFEYTNTINPKRLLALELLSTYWHFIDLIWIYLFIFFYFNY